jgi:hypothetical protein
LGVGWNRMDENIFINIHKYLVTKSYIKLREYILILCKQQVNKEGVCELHKRRTVDEDEAKK